jgi:hypothetical protein
MLSTKYLFFVLVFLPIIYTSNASVEIKANIYKMNVTDTGYYLKISNGTWCNSTSSCLNEVCNVVVNRSIPAVDVVECYNTPIYKDDQYTPWFVDIFVFNQNSNGYYVNSSYTYFTSYVQEWSVYMCYLHWNPNVVDRLIFSDPEYCQ